VPGRNAAGAAILNCALIFASAAWSGPARAECDRPSFRIVIDVGHSREAPGAISARGEPEFDFNRALAKEVAARLVKAGFSGAKLMVSGGRGRNGLARRAARANSMGASLLLSIHHDSVQSVYLKKWTYGGRKLRFSDRFKGYSLFVSGANPQFQQSLRIARALGAALQARGLTFTKHHAENIRGERRELLDAERGVYRYDQLIVLKNAQAPALLLEAGVIVNREEELAAASPQRRRLIAEAAAEAIAAFCAAAPQKR
jgi:N-acetylmuramoyl-L-alanine amidase